MAVRSFRSLALVVGALGTQAITQGCVDDGVSMHVICPIPPEVDEGGCTWDPAGDTCVAEGVINLQSATRYGVTLRVESGLKPRARDVPPIGEPNGVQISRARIELRSVDGARVDFLDANAPNPFDVVASGFLAPNSAGATTLQIIPQAYLSLLKEKVDLKDPKWQQLVAAITLRGKTSGDVDVESSEYFWPIRLIRTSTVLTEGACVPIDTCVGGVGQDGFAQACTQ